jgi:hypothetical protein
MQTEADVRDVLIELERVLKVRAKAKGLEPGSRDYRRYVCGTMSRERKRLQSVTKRVTNPSHPEAQ